MKKVMIYAYTKFNLGDDLFIKVLCERYPNVKFVLYAPKEYKFVFNQINNLQVIPSNSFIIRFINLALRQIRKGLSIRQFVANRCNAAVYIGGSIFMQQDNWQQTLRKKEKMKIKNKPFYVIGANFGPYQDEEFYVQYKELFKTYTDICFREEYSYNLFNDLENVRVANDVIFNLKSQKKLSRKNIVISVIKPSIRKEFKGIDEIYYQKIKELSIYFIDKGYEVILMSFCEYEEDNEAVEEILRTIPKKYSNCITKHFYKYNLDETLTKITTTSFVIATRFHAMILGWVYNKPVFPIIYSKKMTNDIKDISFSGLYTEIKKINTLDVSQVYENMKKNKIDLTKHLIDAEKQFEKLDEFLLN